MSSNIITVDGSAWTGKTTVSKTLAKLMGFQHINTGSMFKAIAFLMQEPGIKVDEKDKILDLMYSVKMEFKKVDDESHLFINGSDFSKNVSDNSLVPIASAIGVFRKVRKQLVSIQRDACKSGNIVIEGRDTGTVVFPNAKWKFYLYASTDIKIKRFFKMLPEKDKNLYTREQVREIIESTDKRDRERKIAPLKIADDAIFYDNSDSPSELQDALILQYYINHEKEITKNATIILNKRAY